MNLTELKPKERFTDRAEDYANFRPRYPAEITNILTYEYGMRAGDRIADVGSGTGLFTEVLLDGGFQVWAVEPNQAMRGRAENRLAGREGFHSVVGTAEDTTLENGGFRAVTVAAAFHWFDPEAAIREFDRILNENGVIFIVANRTKEGPSFNNEWKALHEKYRDPLTAWDRRAFTGEGLSQTFSQRRVEEHHAYCAEKLDLTSLLGRMRSMSSLPKQDHARYPALRAEMTALFKRYQRDGFITVEHDCAVYSMRK